jgi:glycosyltransferase involved in cell wall biosynthesis
MKRQTALKFLSKRNRGTPDSTPKAVALKSLQSDSNFDPVFYMREYPDVADANVDPLAHYVEHGVAEGRHPRMPGTTHSHLLEFEPPPNADCWRPHVSVIVPLSSDASMLAKRLTSIYGQTYHGEFDVVVFSDGLHDAYQETVRSFGETFADKTVVVPISGDPEAAPTWREGFSMAMGELVWIADSGEDCEPEFLATAIPLLANPAVMLAFCGAGSRKTGTPWIYSPADRARDGMAMKIGMPTMGRSVFRHPGALFARTNETWMDFYLELTNGGLVAYTSKKGTAQKVGETSSGVRVATRKVWTDRAQDRPHLLMVAYGFVAGGAEIFAIHLANALRMRGWTVSFVELGECDSDPQVRDMLNSCIPRYRLTSPKYIAALCDELEIDVIHTGNVSCDLAVARALRAKTRGRHPRHVITLHGGYETLAAKELSMVAGDLSDVDQFVYIASKNLMSFSSEFRAEHRFSHIPNALPKHNVVARIRQDADLPSDATVAMVVSRAIPEKGWDLAQRAIEIVRGETGENIHLVLIGNGPTYDQMLIDDRPDWVHLLGFQSDVRSWMALADIGLLATTFSGESFPLVLVDFMTMGVPVVASAIGEIAEMIRTDSGSAGRTVDVGDPLRLVANFADAVRDFVLLPQSERDEMRQRALSAARKFDFDAVVNAYEQLYGGAIASAGPS